jgi:hypothetical protein
MLQWVGLLWVGVQFPHIALLQKNENKKLLLAKKLESL